MSSPRRALPNLLVSSAPDAYLVRSVDPAPWWLGQLEEVDGAPAAVGYEPAPDEASRLELLRTLLHLSGHMRVECSERYTRRRRPYSPPRFRIGATFFTAEDRSRRGAGRDSTSSSNGAPKEKP